MTDPNIIEKVGSDPEYHYEVIVNDQTYAVAYIEPARNIREYISFASLDEMEHVAKCMLRVVNFTKNS